MKKDLTWKVRGTGIALMGLTAVFTVLGGVGTVCVAWGAEKWKPFAVLVPYKPIYQWAAVITLIAGVAGIIVTYALLRGERWSYVGALFILLVGFGTAAVKMYYSNMLRGSTAPTNFRAYVTVLTLVVFLLMRLPWFWNRTDFTSPPTRFGSWATPAGMSLFTGGLVALLTPVWVGPTHVVDGVNLVNVIRVPLLVGGVTMAATGAVLLVLAGLGRPLSLARSARSRVAGAASAAARGTRP